MINIQLSNLLRRDVESLCSHVNLLVDVDAGEDEEDARAAGAARQEEAQSENDSSLVFLADISTELSQL